MTHRTDVDAALAELTPTYVTCRDYGHAWKPWRAEKLARNAGFDQWLRCGRCGTERHRLLSRYGEVLASRYTYPDGYQLRGVGRLTGEDRGLLRLASVLDTVNKGQTG